MWRKVLSAVDDVEALVDHYSAGFVFTPYNSLTVPLATIAVYLVAVPVLTQLVKLTGIKLKLTLFSIIHNLFLSVSSFVLLLLIGSSLARKYRRTSFVETLCDPSSEDVVGRLTFLYTVNYFLKYYELLDTFLMVLKGKNVIFLHWYHHPATLFLCWTQLYGGTGVQCVPIVLNLAVHAIMYLYYALATMKIRCWWKKYVTVFQIAQFVIDMTVCWGIIFLRYANTNLGCTWCPACSFQLEAGLFGAALLSSYLVLFILFYRRVYPSKKSQQSTHHSQSNGHTRKLQKHKSL